MTELLRRYRSVFGAAWAARSEREAPARNTDEAAFLPAALSLQDTPVHPAPRRLAYAIMALFVLALAWAAIGEVDIVAVAQGRIVVDDRTKQVQPLERSVVKRVLVRDGDRVQAGQPLIELDSTMAAAEVAAVHEQVQSAQGDALRAGSILQALNGGLERPLLAPPAEWSAADRHAAESQMMTEWADIKARLGKLSSELDRRRAEVTTSQELVAKLETTLPLARQREQEVTALAEEGYAANHAAQDKARERVEMERDLATQRARIAEALAALRETDSARRAYLAEAKRTLSDREAQASFKQQQATQDQAKATQRQKLTLLAAPVSGTVQQLAAHTPGGVVTEAQTLLIVVPDGAQVTAEVTLENKDIGFVSVGQHAEVKLETFPFTRYGTVPAVVSRVSADAVNDDKRGALFPVSLTMNLRAIDVDGKAIRLSPGMNLTAEIKTGRRRVIDFLLSPIQRAKAESLRER